MRFPPEQTHLGYQVQKVKVRKMTDVRCREKVGYGAVNEREEEEENKSHKQQRKEETSVRLTW